MLAQPVVLVCFLAALRSAAVKGGAPLPGEGVGAPSEQRPQIPPIVIQVERSDVTCSSGTERKVGLAEGDTVYFIQGKKDLHVVEGTIGKIDSENKLVIQIQTPQGVKNVSADPWRACSTRELAESLMQRLQERKRALEEQPAGSYLL